MDEKTLQEAERVCAEAFDQKETEGFIGDCKQLLRVYAEELEEPHKCQLWFALRTMCDDVWPLALAEIRRLQKNNATLGTMTSEARQKAETFEERAEKAEALLREALPFIGWSSKPEGLTERISAALGEREGSE